MRRIEVWPPDAWGPRANSSIRLMLANWSNPDPMAFVRPFPPVTERERSIVGPMRRWGCVPTPWAEISADT